MFFTFNDINSKDIGLRVKDVRFDTMAKRRISELVLNKYDGTIYTDEETYESYSLDIECIIRDNFNISNILKVKNMFKGGMGELRLSHKPGRTYKAVLNNTIDFTEMLNLTGGCVLTFKIEPFAYLDSGKEYVTVSNGGKLINLGNYISKPQIRVTTTGNFTIGINSKPMKFNNVTKPFIIDCELEDIVGVDGSNLNNYLDISSDLQFLSEGTNNISLTGLTSIEVKPNWREL